MALPANGFTTDEVVGQTLVETGMQLPLFREDIRAVVKAILAAKEVAGTLTTAEKQLQNEIIGAGFIGIGSPGFTTNDIISRIIEFIKQDSSGKWGLRGMWLGSGDLTAIINAQWANILKKYS